MYVIKAYALAGGVGSSKCLLLVGVGWCQVS